MKKTTNKTKTTTKKKTTNTKKTITKNKKNTKKKLDKEVLEFKVKTGEGDKVFGSISLKQIKDELQKKGYTIEKSAIKYDNPIQSLGFHNIEINLYPGVTSTIKVHVIK